MSQPPLRLLIVDDEAPARNRLKDLLADICAELPNAVAGEAADGVEALEFLTEPSVEPVDVLLVDIRMPRLDGIGLAQHLAARGNAPAVIFTTAYDQYAVSAFDLNAIDYLLKPVSAPRLLAALKKISKLSKLPDAAALRSLAPERRVHLHSSERGRILLVPLASILFLRAELKYVTAQTRERQYLIEESLTHLEEEFSERFIRLHRNCLVARNAIIGVERESESDGETRWSVLLRDVAERLPVSRRQWPLIKALLKEER
ncbi:MAG: response regulator transcription factor [Betaproteobacteria bacterium]|nr:response regulator transcription factor [Betaproteobacteria bacterium]